MKIISHCSAHNIPGFILAALFSLVAMAYADTTIYNKN